MTLADDEPEIVTLDPVRVSELEGLFPDGDLAEFLLDSVRELGSLIDDAGTAIERNDLEAVAFASHSARNHALMCGATDLGLALEVLQTAANGTRPDWVSKALRQVREAWPPTRAAIERLGRGPSSPAGKR